MLKVIFVIIVGLGLNLGTVFIDTKEFQTCDFKIDTSDLRQRFCNADFVKKQAGFPTTFYEQDLEATSVQTNDVEDFTKQVSSSFDISGFLKNQFIWMFITAILLAIFLFLSNIVGTLVLSAIAAAVVAAYLGLITFG